MLTMKLTSDSKEYKEVESLYITSFPENERSPLHLLLEDPTGCSEVYSFYDAAIFCGFACLLTFQDITHILYFAVAKSQQKKGYGSYILNQLQQLKPTQRLIADIEKVSCDALNDDQRHKRKAFYLKNGYHVTNVSYEWRQEDYEILVSNKDLSREEFERFWEQAAQRNPSFMQF